MTEPRPLARVGWREWVCLPDLGVGPLPAKVDTGAKTSALHALNVQAFERDNQTWVRFRVPPSRFRPDDPETEGQALLQGYREVRSSNGRTERRPTIWTRLHLGDAVWDIHLTLTDRRLMGFRMLLGRQALRRRVLVDCAGSFLLGRPSPRPKRSKLRQAPG